MDNLLYQSTVRLAKAIRNKEISSEELVSAYIKRIEEVNPKLNAVVQLVSKSALDDARKADVALQQREILGPLHGVPMTIKDSFDTAGIISTGGTKGREHFIPDEDATVVTRLKKAGAILLGKTNTPELTLAGHTDNLIYGQTNNPYDLTRSSGGSSGGPAAIIAVGGIPFDIGTDTGGSIRIPSHMCGIAGIKPTAGRVPRTGHIISFDIGVTDALTQPGPMARYVEDLSLILPIISGVDWRDPLIVPMPLGNPEQVEVRGLRVAYFTDNGSSEPTDETVSTVQEAVKILANAGCIVEEKRPPGAEDVTLWGRVFSADGGATVRNLLKVAGTKENDPIINWALPEQAVQTDEFAELIAVWNGFRSNILAFIENYDVIVSPALPAPAPCHSEVAIDVSYLQTHNLSGFPSCVIRGGTSPEGLPIGVQIVAQPWREDIALAVAQHLEQAFGGWQPPSL